MPKTPDEIKKGLFVCSDFEGNCPYCPYAVNGHIDHEGMCMKKLANDADILVRQLEAQNAEKDARIQQLEAERDAAVADITRMVQEPYDPCYCDYCKLTDEECGKSNCRGRNAFAWRGVQKEDDDD
jgi:hypothetical protein